MTQAELIKKYPNNYLNNDFSFKNWFTIMLQNFYIPAFILVIALMVICCFTYGQIDWGFALIQLILGSAAGLIIGKGFIQFWNDLKNGVSR